MLRYVLLLPVSVDCVKDGGGEVERNKRTVIEKIQRFVPVSVRRVPQTWTIRCNTDWECIFWSTSSSSSISCRFASVRSSRMDLTGRQRPFSSDSSLPGSPLLIYRPWARIEARNKCHPICCPVIRSTFVSFARTWILSKRNNFETIISGVMT